MKTKTNYGTVAYGIAVLIFLGALLSVLGLIGIAAVVALVGAALAVYQYKKGNSRGMLFGFGLAICSVLLLIFLKLK